ncbi:hypothetical protein [Bdellovibrio bacteriovorus]|uniref:hypothetical protein n=1 Tax=Bdellovibrio bacteriovorus TaxID=959 RepID=UPI0035A74210
MDSLLNRILDSIANNENEALLSENLIIALFVALKGRIESRTDSLDIGLIANVFKFFLKNASSDTRLQAIEKTLFDKNASIAPIISFLNSEMLIPDLLIDNSVLSEEQVTSIRNSILPRLKSELVGNSFLHSRFREEIIMYIEYNSTRELMNTIMQACHNNDFFEFALDCSDPENFYKFFTPEFLKEKHDSLKILNNPQGEELRRKSQLYLKQKELWRMQLLRHQ